MDLKKVFKKAQSEVTETLADVDAGEVLEKFFRQKKPDAKLDRDTNLFESGFVNSMFALETVMFIEKTFNVKLGKKDITKENLSSINKMVLLVERLKNE